MNQLKYLDSYSPIDQSNAIHYRLKMNIKQAVPDTVFNNLMESRSLCTPRNGPIIVQPNRSNSVNHNELAPSLFKHLPS